LDLSTRSFQVTDLSDQRLHFEHKALEAFLKGPNTW
jgi:hypothetical protein